MNYYRNFLRNLLVLFLLAACSPNNPANKETDPSGGSEQGEGNSKGGAVDKEIALTQDEKVFKSKEAEEKALTNGKELIKGLSQKEIDDKLQDLISSSEGVKYKKIRGLIDSSENIRNKEIGEILLQKHVPGPETAEKILLHAVKNNKLQHITFLLEKETYEIDDTRLRKVLLKAFKKREKTVLLILENVKAYIRQETVREVFLNAAGRKKIKTLEWILENKNLEIDAGTVCKAANKAIQSKGLIKSKKPQVLRLIVEKRSANLTSKEVGKMLTYAVDNTQYTLAKLIFDNLGTSPNYEEKITEKAHYRAIKKAVKKSHFNRRRGHLLVALLQSYHLNPVFEKAVREKEIKVIEEMIAMAYSKNGIKKDIVYNSLKEAAGGREKNKIEDKNKPVVFAILNSVPLDFFETQEKQDLFFSIKNKVSTDVTPYGRKIHSVLPSFNMYSSEKQHSNILNSSVASF